MKKNKLAAVLTACLVAATLFTAPTVKADGNDNFQIIHTVQIKQYLVLEKGVSVPSVTFRYTLAPGLAATGDESTHEIMAGPAGAVFASGGSTASVIFSPTDAAADESSAPSDSTIQFTTSDASDEAYVEKALTVDLSGVTFSKPGIYRYVITQEPSDIAGIISDSVNKRYLDVFVYKSDRTDEDEFVPGTVIVRLNNGLPDAEGKTDAAIKSTGFTNLFRTNSLGFQKSVTGNQASFRQYFKFTVKLTGEQTAFDGDTRVKVSGSFDAQPSENMATHYDASVMAAANDGVEYVTLSQLTAGRDFYIKSGQSVLLTGIPDGMGYEVAETQEDYTPSVEVTGDGECTPANSKVTDTSLTEDTMLEFTNTRNGLIPSTGIPSELALPVAVMLAGVVEMALLVIRRIRKQASERNATE